MKKVISTLLAILMVITAFPMTAINTFAAGTATSGTTGDCTWSLDGTVLTIRGNGEMENSNNTSYQSPWGESITEVVIEEGVTLIGNWAFLGCTSLTSVTIPNSVTSIGMQAFDSCTSLTSITIPDGVTSIGSYAFEECTELTDITISDSVTSIGNYAFSNTAYYNDESNWEDDVLYIGAYLIEAKNDITGNYVIKDGTKCISSYAFSYCRKLTSVTIPDSVTSIGGCAFENCTSLTNITIGDNVTSIGGSAFKSCTSLTNITIPDSVTSIGYQSFKSCTKLTSITIGDGVTSIGDSAFKDCTALLQVNIFDISTWCHISFDDEFSNPLYYAHNLYLDGELVENLVIPDSVTTIGGRAFADCTPLKSVTIGDNVRTISYRSFENCTSLKSVTIPDSVTSIGYNAFYNTAYYNDESNWKNSVLYIGSYLIEAKESITGDYVIKDGTRIIADQAFANCTKLTSITIPDSVTSIGDATFYGCTSLTSITIGNDVTSIGDRAFEGCTKLTSVIIPDGVTSIGERAFKSCTKLTSVTIPDSVTSIGDCAFSVCTSLTKVNISDISAWCNIDFIDYGEYSFCYSNPLYYGHYLYLNGELVENLVIPDGVTSIGYSAFVYCKSLTSVTIPDSVTSIGDRAFEDCKSLTSVTILDGVTSIGYRSFYYCESLTSVTIPDSVTSIGSWAFGYCKSLTSIAIPDSVTSIGVCAFENCTSLTNITIGDNVTSIGDDAFYNTAYYNDESNWETNELYIGPHLIMVNSITGDYVIKDGTKCIADWAFYYCYLLTSVTIPDSVTSIGYSAFEECTSLTSVNISDISAWYNISFDNEYSNPLYYAHNLYLNGELIENLVVPDGVTSIGSWAFAGCGLTSVTIPDSVTSIGESAFTNCSSLTKVNISDISAWCNIDFYNRHSNPLYCAHNLYLNGELVENLVIPNGVTSIGKWAFAGCGLTSVTIPDYVISIDKYAFFKCTSLNKITTSCGLGANICVDESLLDLQHDSIEWVVDIEPTCTTDGSKSSYCTRCGGKVDESIIPALGHNHVNNVCTRCGDLLVKYNGWRSENGKWAYYNNGVKVANQWRKDTKGWCFLGADGYMVTGTSVKDSKGWCLVDGSGYWITSTGWKHIGGCWYYVQSGGYLKTNGWMKDSKGWCFLDAQGKMVTGTSVKDSKGWCLVDGSGYWVTSSGWKYIGGTWYYVQSDGYLKTNGWMKDSKGWCFLDTQGRMLNNMAVKDSNGWCLLNASGYWVTGNHTGVKIQKSYNDDLKLITYDIKNGYIVNPKEYCIEIEEENKRHNDEIDRINSNYDYLIEEAEYMASYIRRESGAYGSSSSYASQVSSLSSQITEKEKKLNIMKMDTSGVYKSQIAALEAELERDYAQLSDLQTKQYCAQEAESYEAEANSYRRNKQAEISNENAKHEQIVKDIKASYNKQ